MKDCARDVYSACACACATHVRTRAFPRGVHAYTRANARPHGVPAHTFNETRERLEAGALRAIGHLTNMAVPLFLTNTTAKCRVKATYRDVRFKGSVLYLLRVPCVHYSVARNIRQMFIEKVEREEISKFPPLHFCQTEKPTFDLSCCENNLVQAPPLSSLIFRNSAY